MDAQPPRHWTQTNQTDVGEDALDWSILKSKPVDMMQSSHRGTYHIEVNFGSHPGPVQFFGTGGHPVTDEFFVSGGHPVTGDEEEQERRVRIKTEVQGLLGSEEERDEEAAPEAVEYACQLIDQFPSECFVLPTPDVSATAKGEVYFEWMLERDGRLLLTVAPDGTVAYVCTFGAARSRNLGAWKDHIADLIPPCFAKLVQIYQKDLYEWDASKIARP